MNNYMYLTNTLTTIMPTESKDDRNLSLIIWITICIFFIVLFILLGVLLHQTWFLIIGIIFSYVILIYSINYCLTDQKISNQESLKE